MPFFVNSGSSTWRVFTGGSAASQRNCAFCSAAGAVNMMLGQGLFTSGHVAKSLGVADDRPGSDSALYGIDKQLNAIEGFVTANTQIAAKWYGSKTDEKPCAEAMAWMKKQPRGTVFVVYASGIVPADNKAVNKSHYLNAKKTTDDLVFFDFQTNRDYKDKPVSGINKFTGSLNPSSCKTPFLGIITQNDTKLSSDLQSNDPGRQTGAFDIAKTKLIVLAFPPAG